ncbi:MAG TPA: glycoside hydrolase 43 family protein [Prolixibacteraceae bacterium]|nr:glycoside hydrolase 43 family protein [Prolixibacteraceae bacterium]
MGTKQNQNRINKSNNTLKGFSTILALALLIISAPGFSQVLRNGYWNADNGDGTFTNPIIHADYSDPDVIRVGDDFYMTASSFNCIPGLPILHSTDLVNWELIGYALSKMYVEEKTSKPQHGNYVWAPAIRFHNGEFYIYWGDPDNGVYVIKATRPEGPWSEPHLIQAAKGWIDTCPFWDEDGNAYLVHAFAGSRAGVKSILVINEMAPDGMSVNKTCKLVFDGNDNHTTVEGPKMYKRNGYYYILAPAGGVKPGWQLALRSKNVYGPYEEKIVLHQGDSPINGPHQGGLVELESGESWFIHFQDKYEYGRILHLQPVQWVNDWPMMGVDTNNDGIGEPVITYKKPNVSKPSNVAPIPVSDEFNAPEMGLQWQWPITPQPEWCFPSTYGFLRMNCMLIENNPLNMWDIPNLLLQKFPAEQFSATTRFELHPKLEGDRAGLIVMGEDYGYLAVEYWDEKRYITFNSCTNARKEQEVQSEKQEISVPVIYMKVAVKSGGMCQFSYSEDGKKFKSIGKTFKARAGMWIGAKLGIFALKTTPTNDSGYADFDWFRVE